MHYLVVLCRKSIITSTTAWEQLESRRVTGTKQRLQRQTVSQQLKKSIIKDYPE